MKATTLGGYLELVSEFEVKGGGAVAPAGERERDAIEAERLSRRHS